MGVKKGTLKVILQIVFLYVMSMGIFLGIPAIRFLTMPDADTFTLTLAGGIAVFILAVTGIPVLLLLAILWALDDVVDRTYWARVEKWQQKSDVEKQLVNLRYVVLSLILLMLNLMLRML